MKTLSITLIEKKNHRDGGTIDHLKSIEAFLITKNARNIILQEIIQQSEFPTLIQIQNSQLTTLLDCSGVAPYEFWYFDEQFQFTGKAYSLYEGSGTFQIQTQAKWVLLVHLKTKEFKNLQDFNCSELDITDKYDIVKRNFPYGYGVFPYIIINHESSPCLTQIPIHINLQDQDLPGWYVEIDEYKIKQEDLLKPALIEESKEYHKNICKKMNRFAKMALVLNAKEAYYFDENSDVTFNESIPTGGILLDVDGKRIADNSKHYL